SVRERASPRSRVITACCGRSRRRGASRYSAGRRWLGRSRASGGEGQAASALNVCGPMVAAAPALTTRDPALAAHAARVTELAARLAAWLQWDDTRLYAMYIGGPLHDIGKVAVSEAILRKPGPLDPAELAEIQTHPTVGAELIGPVGPASEALPYVLYHHERWDGDGYPTGRRGPQIPEGARILAV